jgi:hypothetical protein
VFGRRNLNREFLNWYWRKIDMFKTAPVVAPPRDVGPAVPMEVGVVPLSHLSLDLSEPLPGWVAYLTGRGVAVVEDDLGRASIPRAAAKMLFDDHRADEVRKAEMRAESERAAVAADREWRAALPRGVPWYELPDGLAPGDAMALAAAKANAQKSVQESLMEQEFGGPQTSMVYQPYPTDEAEPS